jgi:hypothetical protein
MDVEVHEDRIVVADPNAIFEFADVMLRTGKFEADLSVTCLDPLETIGRTPPYQMHISARSQSSQDGFRRALDKYFTLGPPADWGRLLPIACRAAEEAYKQTIESLDPDDFTMPLERSELVEGVLPEGQLTCFFGMSEAAKSLSVLAMCMAMAAEVPFAGKRTHYAGTLWLDAENPQMTEFAIRKNQLALSGQYESGAGAIRWMSTKGLSAVDLLPAVRREIERFHPKLVVVDSAGFVAGGNPIDPEAALKTCNALFSIKRTIVLIAQTTKDDNDKMPFGSTYWHYAVHGKSWYVNGGGKETGSMTSGFYLRKSSDGQRPSDFAVKFSFDGDMGPITVMPGDLRQLNAETGRGTEVSRIRGALLTHGALLAKEISDETGIPVANVSAGLTKMQTKGEVQKAGGMRWSVIETRYDE